MPLYIGLFRFTDEGVRVMKDLPSRTLEIVHKLEDQGFAIHGTYFTLGEYDLVSIIEAPSEVDQAKAVLILNQLGFIRTHTMRAFTMDEFTQFADELP